MDHQRAQHFAEQWYAAWREATWQPKSSSLDSQEKITRYFAHYT